MAAEAGRRLAALRRLNTALADGKLKGLPRGIAYRLSEAGGVLDRAQVRAEAKALSQVERRALKGLGVKLGAFSLYLPALLQPRALAFSQAFAGAAWRPPAGQVSLLPDPPPPATTLAAFGLRAVGPYAVPVEALEQLDALLRDAPKQGQGSVISDEARTALGWSDAELRGVLRALNFTPTARPKSGEPTAWRRRNDKPAPAAPVRAVPPHSPFAALAALTARPDLTPPARRPRRRRKPKAARP